jgi:hypothetical protein
MKPTDAFRLPKTRVCSTCKKEKPLSEYRRSSEAPDRRQSKCKACEKQKEETKKEEQKSTVKNILRFKIALIASKVGVNVELREWEVQ